MRALIIGIAAVMAGQSMAQEAPDPGKEALVDEGLFVVSGRPGMGRAEEFSVYKRPDGGYTLLSTITADDDSYIASGSWSYDAQWRSLSARGQSNVKGTTRTVEIKRENSPEGPIVRMIRRTTPQDGALKHETFTAACDMDCLIDMTPAAMTMSVMTRRFDKAKGGEQSFRWVGASLTDDQVLLDGGAALWFVRMQQANGAEIAHWRFREDLPGLKPGERVQMNMHLWTDAQDRMRKFGVGRGEKPSTIGIRESDEKISEQMKPD
jgi:hypothetical protein